MLGLAVMGADGSIQGEICAESDRQPEREESQEEEEEEEKKRRGNMDRVDPNQMAAFKIKSVCRLSCWKQESNICCPAPLAALLRIYQGLWEMCS